MRSLLFLGSLALIACPASASPRRSERDVDTMECSGAENKVFSPCGNCSYLTCDLIKTSVFHRPCELCSVDASPRAGCRCKDGYVWLDQVCVTVESCPNPCNGSNEHLATCVYGEIGCQPSCSAPNRANDRDLAEKCTRVCDIPVCVCDRGYLRHDVTGECIQAETCPHDTVSLANGTDLNQVAFIASNATLEDETTPEAPTVTTEQPRLPSQPSPATEGTEQPIEFSEPGTTTESIPSTAFSGSPTSGSEPPASTGEPEAPATTTPTEIPSVSPSSFSNSVAENQQNNASVVPSESTTLPSEPTTPEGTTPVTETSTPGASAESTTVTEPPQTAAIQETSPVTATSDITAEPSSIAPTVFSPTLPTTTPSFAPPLTSSLPSTEDSPSAATSSESITTAIPNNIVESTATAPNAPQVGRTAPTGIIFYWRTNSVTAKQR